MSRKFNRAAKAFLALETLKGFMRAVVLSEVGLKRTLQLIAGFTEEASKWLFCGGKFSDGGVLEFDAHTIPGVTKER